MNNELLNDFACDIIRHYGNLNKKLRKAHKEHREAIEQLGGTRSGNHGSEMLLRTRIAYLEELIESIKVDQETCDEALRRLYKSDEK